jgi:microcin C transport system substrate-binding protein
MNTLEQTLLRARLIGLPIAALAILSACGGGDAGSGFAEQDNTEEVEAYYAQNTDFFRFATPADVPAGLVWESGADLPELGSPNAQKGGEFRMRLQDFPNTLRTIGPDANGGFRPYLLDDMSLTLARIHPNLPGGHQYYPEIASEWALDEANQTVYVRLDPAARWSDGNPITADDMTFMFYFMQSPHIQEPWYNNWYGEGVNYSQITKYDDHTISIRLSEARPDMLAKVLELRPLPREYYRDFGEDFVERYQWAFQPTSGPYVITDEELQRIRTDRTGITLTRLENWWGDDKRNLRYRFNPATFSLRVIRDTPKAFEASLASDLDFVGSMSLAEYWYDQFPNEHELVQRGLIHKTTFYNDIPRPTYGLWINTARPLLDNVDIRLGIHYASNWQLVLDQYFRGDYARMNTSSDGYGEFVNPDIQARPFDLQKAAEHFAKAGFTRRGPDGVLVNDQGQRLSFNLSTGYENLAPILNILRQEAMKAGLEFQVEILDSASAWKKVQEKNHDIGFTAFAVSVEQYPRYWETYHSVNAYDQAFLADGVTPNPQRTPKTQTNNLSAVAIPEVDRLIDQYDDSTDLEEMKQIAYQIQQILHDNAAFVPGFIQPTYRTAYWRWIQHPDDFNVRFSRDPFEYNLFWVDEQMKEETLAARRGTQSFPVGIHVYDQWRVNGEGN